MVAFIAMKRSMLALASAWPCRRVERSVSIACDDNLLAGVDPPEVAREACLGRPNDAGFNVGSVATFDDEDSAPSSGCLLGLGLCWLSAMLIVSEDELRSQ